MDTSPVVVLVGAANAPISMYKPNETSASSGRRAGGASTVLLL
jgi:hypothetical protein